MSLEEVGGDLYGPLEMGAHEKGGCSWWSATEFRMRLGALNLEKRRER